MKSLTITRLAATLMMSIICFTPSCKKKQNTIAKIKIVTTDNQIVKDAMVRLWPNPDPVLKPMIEADTLYTNSEGYAIFNYTDDFNLGQAGFRVLDIEVNSEDVLFGEGIIKIVEEETTIKKIVVSAI